MLDTDNMNESKNKASSIWMQYTMSKHKNDKNYVFCFFEGEDRKYYLERINKLSKNINHFCCEGRCNVISVYEKIIDEEGYNNNLLFFVDRDYNLDSYEDNPDIYQTSEYSIENYYCKESVIEGVLEKEMGMNKGESDFELAINIFSALKKKFIEYYFCINIWYMACKKLNINVKVDELLGFNDFDLNPSNLNIKKEINLDSIQDIYLIILKNNCKSNKKHADENFKEYNAYIEYIKKEMENINSNQSFNINKDFRGKFLLIFLRKYINLLHSMNNSKEFSIKYLQFYLDGNSNNLLSELSAFAETPECLMKYLERANC